jgi:hypothetical protein
VVHHSVPHFSTLIASGTVLPRSAKFTLLGPKKMLQYIFVAARGNNWNAVKAEMSNSQTSHRYMPHRKSKLKSRVRNKNPPDVKSLI